MTGRPETRNLLPGALMALVAVVLCLVGTPFASGTFTKTIQNTTNTAASGIPTTTCTAGPVTLTADADTYIAQNQWTTNYGTSPQLQVLPFSSANRRGLVHFALPSLPDGCQLASARLTLTAASSTAGRILNATRVSTAWSETTVTWNTGPQVAGTPASTRSGTSPSFDVTAIVNTQYTGSNLGIEIQDSIEGGSSLSTQAFNSREASTGRPQLTLAYG